MKVELKESEVVFAVVPDTHIAPDCMSHIVVVHIRDMTTGGVRSAPIINEDRSEILKKIHGSLESLHRVALDEVLKNYVERKK